VEVNKIEERRRFFRFPTNLKCLYYLEGDKEGLNKCNIFNISYEGLGIKFHTSDKIKIGLKIHFGIINKWEITPISVKGILKWIEDRDNYFVGGIELTKALDNITLTKLF